MAKSLANRCRASDEKHTVAVAEETVLLADGVGIGGENTFATGEGADQHEEAGLGQVEVGEHGVDKTKTVAGGDEDVGFAGVSRKF